MRIEIKTTTGKWKIQSLLLAGREAMHNFFFHAQIRHMSMAKHLYKWQSECQYLLTYPSFVMGFYNNFAI